MIEKKAGRAGLGGPSMVQSGRTQFEIFIKRVKLGSWIYGSRIQRKEVLAGDRNLYAHTHHKAVGSDLHGRTS